MNEKAAYMEVEESAEPEQHQDYSQDKKHERSSFKQEVGARGAVVLSGMSGVREESLLHRCKMGSSHQAPRFPQTTKLLMFSDLGGA